MHSQGEAAVSLLGALLMVALGIYAYLSEFIILPLFFDIPPKTGSAFLVLFIPFWQWMIIVVATALGWAVNRGALMLDQHRVR